MTDLDLARALVGCRSPLVPVRAALWRLFTRDNPAYPPPRREERR